MQGRGRSKCQSLSSPQTACCQQFPKLLHLITVKAQAVSLEFALKILQSLEISDLFGRSVLDLGKY